MVLAGVLRGRVGVFALFFYVQFLQFRFLCCEKTRLAVKETEATLDYLILNEKMPLWLQSGYQNTKEMISRYGNLENRSKQHCE